MSPAAVLTVDVESDASAAVHDADALGRLYDRYCDAVFNYLLVRTRGDRPTAEDLSQATWERVVAKIGGYERRGEGGFAAWLMTITRRVFLDHCRRGPVRHRSSMAESIFFGGDRVPEQETPEQAYLRKVRAHKLAAAVESLPRTQRQCVELRFMVGLSVVETAAAMNRNPNAIKQLQYRACQSLKKALSDDPLMSPPTVSALLVPHQPGERWPLDPHDDDRSLSTGGLR